MISQYLRRGMAAGLLAGLLAGLFAFVTGEPTLDRAIELEGSARGAELASLAHPSGEERHSHGDEGGVAISRSVQKVGLVVTTAFTGTFVGGLFGLAFAYFRGRLASGSDWYRSLSLAAAVFAGAALIPFLKYPANPPTVGDPETIGIRTVSYFAMVGLGLLAVLAAWHGARTLRERGVGAPARHTALGLGLAAVVTAMLLVFPATVDPGDFPAGLLWNFRLSSLGTQLVLWIGLGAIFGALCERANRRQTA